MRDCMTPWERAFSAYVLTIGAFLGALLGCSLSEYGLGSLNRVWGTAIKVSSMSGRMVVAGGFTSGLPRWCGAWRVSPISRIRLTIFFFARRPSGEASINTQRAAVIHVSSVRSLTLYTEPQSISRANKYGRNQMRKRKYTVTRRERSKFSP